MDKEIEDRFNLIEKVIEGHLAEHHKMITRLRVEVEMLKSELGKSDIMKQFDKAIPDRKPVGKR